MDNTKKIKAVILLSGGLDSTLAAYIAKDQAIELVALNFSSPFCMCSKKGGCNHSAGDIAQRLGIKFVVINNAKEILEAVKKPKFGYGSNMNPCIDCRVAMLKKAKEYMLESGASFIITGEVLEQRPMSQRRNIMSLIEKESGLEGLIVRPLSAKTLEETLPEKQGWIKREKLLNIAGRGRRRQMELAKEFGINDYPCPAGGCLLTDPNFARRLRDLMKYNPDFSLNDAICLRSGRHLRLKPQAKLIVGRNEQENKTLLDLSLDTDLIFMPDESIAGPTAIGRGKFNPADKELAATLLAHYCDRQESKTVKIILKDKSSNQEDLFQSLPACEELVDKFKL